MAFEVTRDAARVTDGFVIGINDASVADFALDEIPLSLSSLSIFHRKRSADLIATCGSVFHTRAILRLVIIIVFCLKLLLVVPLVQPAGLGDDMNLCLFLHLPL